MSYEQSDNIIENKICSNVEQDSYIYVFEIIVTLPDNTINYKKITYNKEGILLELENNSIKKIKITMCKINNINNITTIRKHFNSIITKPIVFCNDNLVITLDKDDNDNIIIRYLIL